jgi:hypothetical protein
LLLVLRVAATFDRPVTVTGPVAKFSGSTAHGALQAAVFGYSAGGALSSSV